MTLAQTTCPHCGATTDAVSAFCQSCGKALPVGVPTSPRIIAGDAIPRSSAGQKLMADELQKHTKRAATTLLVVGLLQLTCGAIAAVLVSQGSGSPENMLVGLLVVQLIVASAFIGLYFWARRAPLPASIVGLIIYVTLVVLNVISSVSSLGEPGSKRGLGGLGIGWLDIVIICFLAQGISAGLKHKRLLASASSAV